jgi:hypothetical protein
MSESPTLRLSDGIIPETLHASFSLDSKSENPSSSSSSISSSSVSSSSSIMTSASTLTLSSSTTASAIPTTNLRNLSPLLVKIQPLKDISLFYSFDQQFRLALQANNLEHFITTAHHPAILLSLIQCLSPELALRHNKGTSNETYSSLQEGFRSFCSLSAATFEQNFAAIHLKSVSTIANLRSLFELCIHRLETINQRPSLSRQLTQLMIALNKTRFETSSPLISKCTSLDDAFAMLSQVEMAANANPPRSPTRRSPSPPMASVLATAATSQFSPHAAPFHPRNYNVNGNTKHLSKTECFYCHRLGHRIADCRKRMKGKIVVTALAFSSPGLGILDNAADISIIPASLLTDNARVQILRNPIPVKGIAQQLLYSVRFVVLKVFDKLPIPFLVVDDDVPLIISLNYLVRHFDVTYRCTVRTNSLYLAIVSPRHHIDVTVTSPSLIFSYDLPTFSNLFLPCLSSGLSSNHHTSPHPSSLTPLSPSQPSSPSSQPSPSSPASPPPTRSPSSSSHRVRHPSRHQLRWWPRTQHPLRHRRTRRKAADMRIYAASISSPANNTTAADLLHCRLGHPGRATLAIVSPGSKTSFCPTCAIAKAQRSRLVSGHPADTTGMRPGTHICLDLFYAPDDAVLTRHRYGMVIADRCSRKLWVVTGRYKSDLAPRAVAILRRIHAVTGNALQEARGDRGTENIYGPLDEYLTEVGATWRPSPPYEPRLNPAETFVNIVKRGMRCLLVHAGMPDTYWVPAVETAAVLHNARPRARSKKSPDEVFGGTQTHLNRLRTFGCLAFPLTDPRATSRSVAHVLLGYAPMGYVLGELTRNRWTGKTFVSNSVTFDENSFPCKQSPAHPQTTTTITAPTLATPLSTDIVASPEHITLDMDVLPVDLGGDHKATPSPVLTFDNKAVDIPTPANPPAPATDATAAVTTNPAGEPPAQQQQLDPQAPLTPPATPPPPSTPPPAITPPATRAPLPPSTPPPTKVPIETANDSAAGIISFPSVHTPTHAQPATPPRRSTRLAHSAFGIDRFDPVLKGKTHATSRALTLSVPPVSHHRHQYHHPDTHTHPHEHVDYTNPHTISESPFSFLNIYRDKNLGL